MKKILNLVLIGMLLASLALGLGACDSKTSENPGMTVKYINGQYTLTKYVQEENVTELTIDQTADGKQITAIKAGAFDGNTAIKKITVSANVTEIAAGAFKRMEALEEITLPFVGAKKENVNEQRLFGYVFGTDSYDEGVSVTQSYNDSSSETYYFPDTLTKVTIVGAADYTLPAYAFYNCSNIKELVITDASAIGDSAFYNCSYLTTMEIPANVEKLGANAFVGCNRLKSVTFAENSKLTIVGNAAFKNTKLSTIALPDGVTTLGENAFEGSNIATISLPSALTEIPYYAFYGCKRLTTVTMNGSALTKIGEAAFQGCEQLTEIGALPASLKTIAAYAFAECDALSEASKDAISAVESVNEFVFGYQG